MSIFYRAKRVGKGGKIFTMYKFKTMRDEPGPVSTAGDDPRITKIGRFLRRTKLDELPQLWNVLKRDMNLVGPRPEDPSVMELMRCNFPEEYAIIISVRPGLTDLATLADIHEEDILRGEADPHKTYLEKIWPQKRKLQIEYIKNRNLLLDIKILTQTTCRLLKK